MQEIPKPGRPAYLTTREVADLLRVKERKVYDLAAAGEIPHRRITGKLLFPAAEIASWIEGDAAPPAGERPAVLTGSHDPLLDWALRESGSGLAMLVDGSRQGLERFAAGGAAICGLHIPDTDGGWNIGSVAEAAVRDCVLIGWASRKRGLLLGPEAATRIGTFADLEGFRIVQRQPGAGARTLFDRLIAEGGPRSGGPDLRVGARTHRKRCGGSGRSRRGGCGHRARSDGAAVPSRLPAAAVRTLRPACRPARLLHRPGAAPARPHPQRDLRATGGEFSAATTFRNWAVRAGSRPDGDAQPEVPVRAPALPAAFGKNSCCPSIS